MELVNEKGTRKGAQIRTFYFLPQMILSIIFLFLTNIFLFDKYTCQKEKEVLQCF